jgi:uncharacterized protein YlzI (FlbEa/FlbD family)
MFLKLTHAGKPVLVNSRHLAYVRRAVSDPTCAEILLETGTHIVVNESLEEVEGKLGNLNVIKAKRLSC